ncbi:MAG: flagellar motor switch protein FliG [Blastocatellia bacterium]
MTEPIVDQVERMPVRRAIEHVSGTRKAAILCMALGDDVASAIFKCLDDGEIQQITRELATLQRVSSEMADDVLEEFYQLLVARTYVVTGGVDYAKRLLTKSFGPEAGKRVLDKVTRSLESSVGFEALQKVDPQQLSKLFQNEHPQTIALVLAHLDVSTAADTIRYLPESLRTDIVLRMASLQTISQEVIRDVSMVLDQKMKSIGSYNPQIVGGIRSVAELCNRLDREVSRKLLEEIEGVQPDLALEIRNRMLTFDDLLLLDDIGIRELLQRVDKKVLTLALKGTAPELQNRIYSNMSSRAVDLMKEELEFMGQVKLKDVTGAQREIIDVLRELDEQGVISIAGGEEDSYVS